MHIMASSHVSDTVWMMILRLHAVPELAVHTALRNACCQRQQRYIKQFVVHRLQYHRSIGA